jgi:hypothetical protein
MSSSSLRGTRSKRPSSNPVVYLLIDVRGTYTWSRSPLLDPNCDAVMLRDFARENPKAARVIASAIAEGAVEGWGIPVDE